MKVLLTSAFRNAGMAAIRGLAKNGVEVIGADDRRLPFNCRSRYLQKVYIHPHVDDEPAFLESLLTIVKRECPDVFFPIRGVHHVAKHSAVFEPYTRILLPPFESYRVANDNQSTLETCRGLGIDCPRIFGEEAAETHLKRYSAGTLIVKPRMDIGGGRGIYFVNSPKALYSAKKIVEEQYKRCVIQEYIPGGTRNMRTVNLLFDRKSQLIAFFTTRKIRQWPNRGGISALSISTSDNKLVEIVLPFFRKYGWKGLAEVELKIDDRDQKVKVIEINPRVWGYLGFPILCGVNFPFICCQAAMGRTLPQNKIGCYRVGLKYLNPFAYAKAAFKEWSETAHKSDLMLRILRELQGKKVGNFLELKDIKVIIAKVFFEFRMGLLGESVNENDILDSRF